MTKMILVPILVLLTSIAFADETVNSVVGKYFNPEFNVSIMRGASAEIYVNESGKLEMSLNVPCGSKNWPAIFAIEAKTGVVGYNYWQLTMLNAGGGQCYLGTSQSMLVGGSSLYIYTGFSELGIKVPGFDGTYYLTKE